MTKLPEKSACWLVREGNHWIRGPFTQSEVLDFLRQRAHTQALEVSKANYYWFSVFEKKEVEKFLPELREAQTQTFTAVRTNDYTSTATLTAADMSKHGSSEIRGEWLTEQDAEDFGFGLADLDKPNNPLQIF